MIKKPKKILIVGSGISGLVLAERYAAMGMKVLVLEKRDHIGGNCYDFINKDGVLISKYGAHIFHTNNKSVWDYVQKFSKFKSYQHRVKAVVDNMIVPVPVNIETVNKLFNLKIKDKKEMNAWLNQSQVKIKDPKNSEEIALSRVGKALYEKIFKNYTIKQWGMHPRKLDPVIMSRIPVRNDFEDRYFSDKYQAQPIGGFTLLFKNMIKNPNIEVQLNTDFFAFKQKIDLNEFSKVFYSGPVDHYFKFCFDKNGLEYRSIEFEFQTFDKEFYQDNSVINYPNDHKYTRIVEYKHITGQKHPKTTISKEYPTSDGDPYYPVLTEKNNLLHSKYKQLIKKLDNIYFIGRLAEFRYLNMDDAFKNALELFDSLEKK
jgi:UDP-galactopyranose mutase